ncbi:MAG: hypothetical protein ACUVTZ_01235 [Armatimonadota bacterium]
MANPLTAYRITQRRLRALFEPFTKQFCPKCEDPCCRKPVKVRPIDLMLAEAHGFSVPDGSNPVRDLLEAASRYLSGGWTDADGVGQPCDFLGEGGCTLPEDLRPFECARYVCPTMRQQMPASWVRDVQRLGKRLDVEYQRLISSLMRRTFSR